MTSPIIGPNPSDREAWLDARRKHVTSTMIARIMRGDGYSVYHELIGDAPAFDGNRATRRGNRFQRPVLEEYAEEAKAVVFDGLPLLIDADCPSLAATPDAVAFVDSAPGVYSLGSDNELLDILEKGSYGTEAKTTLSPKVAAELSEGEEGSDFVPEDWVWQTQGQMACCNWEYVDVAILLFGRLKIRRVERNSALIDACRATAEEYAERVAKRLEPPLDASSEANRETVKTLYRPTPGVTIDLSEEAVDLWLRREANAGVESAAKKAKEGFDTELRKAFGGAEIGNLPGGGVIKLKTINVSEHMVKGSQYTRFYYSKPKE